MADGGPIQPIGDAEVREAVKRTEARLAEMGIKLDEMVAKLDEIDAKLEKINESPPMMG